jgi:endonuclease-3
MVNEKEIVESIKLVKKASRNFTNTALMDVASVPENAFQVLISCLISLRTRDEVTAAASKRLFDVANTPEKIMKLDAKRIEKLIYPCGFYRAKAKRIREIAKQIHELGHVPDTMEELLKFKGVGRKTANIVLVYGHNKKWHIPVDTHVHRIPNRLGWISTKNPAQTEQALEKIIPRRYWHDFNDLFVSFGQNVCKPVGPKCNICPINKYCEYYEEVYNEKKKRSVKLKQGPKQLPSARS